MSNSKKARLPENGEEMEDEEMVEDSSDDDGSDEDINMDVDAGWQVSMDVMGFPPKDCDFHGIKQLLEQLFTKNPTGAASEESSKKPSLQLSEFADALIAQNTIGTVLKDAEEPSEGDDVVYALVTCYSLTRAKKSQLLTSLRNLLVSKCLASAASKEDKKKFTDIIGNSWSESGDLSKCQSCVGLFLNERYINLPFEQAAPQMFGSLMDEVKAAKSTMRQVRHDFTHYVMISKISKVHEQGGSSETKDVSFFNNEEEVFSQEAMLSFDFDVVSHHTTKSRRLLVLKAQTFNRIMANAGGN